MHWLGPYVIKEIIDGGVVQFVKLNGEPFPGKVNGSRLKPYTGDPDRWLYEGSTVLALHATERRCRTINYTARVGDLHEERTTGNKGMSQGPPQRAENYATKGETT